jgi:hypothetical protein
MPSSLTGAQDFDGAHAFSGEDRAFLSATTVGSPDAPAAAKVH